MSLEPCQGIYVFEENLFELFYTIFLFLFALKFQIPTKPRQDSVSSFFAIKIASSKVKTALFYLLNIQNSIKVKATHASFI